MTESRPNVILSFLLFQTRVNSGKGENYIHVIENPRQVQQLLIDSAHVCLFV